MKIRKMQYVELKAKMENSFRRSLRRHNMETFSNQNLEDVTMEVFNILLAEYGKYQVIARLWENTKIWHGVVIKAYWDAVEKIYKEDFAIASYNAKIRKFPQSPTNKTFDTNAYKMAVGAMDAESSKYFELFKQFRNMEIADANVEIAKTLKVSLRTVQRKRAELFKYFKEYKLF